MTAWTLVFHILGLVFWVGGLLIETSVLAQHAQESLPEVRQAMGRLEMRLLNGMAAPGALISVLTGIILVFTNSAYFLHAGWLHAKLALVVVLIGLHATVFSRTRSFIAGRIELERRDCMILHGAVSLTLVGILVLVLPGRIFMR